MTKQATTITADTQELKKEFTRLAVQFPKESGRAGHSLGVNLMKSMRSGLRDGRSRSRLANFTGGWSKLNALYRILLRLGPAGDRRTFGGKLAGGKGSKGSPIGYYYDAQGMSVSVGMFRSVPGMRNAKSKQSKANPSESAARAFEKFQGGSTHGAYTREQKLAILSQIAGDGGTARDLTIAKREMARAWTTPARPMIEPMNSANHASWLKYLVSQTRFNLRKISRKAATA